MAAGEGSRGRRYKVCVLRTIVENHKTFSGWCLSINGIILLWTCSVGTANSASAAWIYPYLGLVLPHDQRDSVMALVWSRFYFPFLSLGGQQPDRGFVWLAHCLNSDHWQEVSLAVENYLQFEMLDVSRKLSSLASSAMFVKKFIQLLHVYRLDVRLHAYQVLHARFGSKAVFLDVEILPTSNVFASYTCFLGA
jgi:hypothetical protein